MSTGDLSDLERRLLSLRGGSKKEGGSVGAVSGTGDVQTEKASIPEKSITEVQPEIFVSRPNPEVDVPVNVKNVSDEEVERFLSLASVSTRNLFEEQPDSEVPISLPSPPTEPPLLPDREWITESEQRRLSHALSSYERLFASDGPSPIEIQFLSSSSASSGARFSGGLGAPHQSKIEEDDDEALMSRMRDELSLENLHGETHETHEDGSDEQKQKEWERRLDSLKSFKLAEGSGSIRPKTQPETSSSLLGAPPQLVNVEDFTTSQEERKRLKALRRRKQDNRNTDSEDDSDSSADNTDSNSSHNE